LDVICQLIPLLTQGALIIDGDEPSNAPELPKKTKAKKKRSKEPLIVRIMQTREGLKLGISCLKHGSAKVFLYRFLLYINSSSITFSATIHWCFVWCWFIFVNFVVLVYLQIDYTLHCTEYSLLRIYFLLYVLSSLTRLNGHGNVFQDRKKIIKSLKGHIMKLALSDFGCLVSNDCIYLQLFWLLNWEYCDLF